MALQIFRNENRNSRFTYKAYEANSKPMNEGVIT